MLLLNHFKRDHLYIKIYIYAATTEQQQTQQSMWRDEIIL